MVPCVLGVLVAIWFYTSAKEVNRSGVRWGFLGFLIPYVLALLLVPAIVGPRDMRVYDSTERLITWMGTSVLTTAVLSFVLWRRFLKK
jgi:predicted cobalt transporter CbtA